MKHITDVYKSWQPTYAAYKNWTNQRMRQVQAMKEMVAEAGEVLAVDVKASRKGLSLDRERVVDELGDTLWGLVGVIMNSMSHGKRFVKRT